MFRKSDDEGSYGGTLLVFLLGVAVGATVAVLYAPMSGQETRAQIAEKAGQLKDRATDLKDQVVDKAGQLKDATVTRMQGMTNRAADTVDTTQESARRVAETVRNEAPNIENAARG